MPIIIRFFYLMALLSAFSLVSCSHHQAENETGVPLNGLGQYKKLGLRIRVKGKQPKKYGRGMAKLLLRRLRRDALFKSAKLYRPKRQQDLVLKLTLDEPVFEPGGPRGMGMKSISRYRVMGQFIDPINRKTLSQFVVH